VNFELKLGREQLLIGRNGAGKSMVFDAVDAVTRFARGEATVDAFFPWERKTRWDTRLDQTFELDFRGAAGESWRYRLVLRHDKEGQRRRVQEEQLSNGEQLLFKAGQGKAQLYRDNGSLGPEVLADWSRSSLPALHERADHTKVTWLKRRLGRVRVAAPDPRRILPLSEQEEAAPTRNLSNLASWYRHLSQEYPDQVESVRDALREVLPCFHNLRLATEGSARRLVTLWQHSEAGSPPLEFGVDELSDGQRVLLGLAMLAAEPGEDDTTLLLDEPDNFVALGEVQPLLMALRMSPKLQLVVISHHPEVINLSAVEHGLVLEREQLGPTRVRPFQAPENSPLTPAELVARGEE
jgi:ATPase subunit of ABC transporter with duplicated ATPase domains